MSDEEFRIPGELKFNDKESYEDYINGIANFNKGLRREDGTLYIQPDFEEKNDEDEEDDYIDEENNVSFEILKEKSTRFILIALFTGIVAGLSVEIIAPKVKKYSLHLWNKLRTKVKKRDNNASTKTDNLTTKIVDDEVSLPVFLQEMDNGYKKYKHNLTSEEAKNELLEIFILAVILANKIKMLSEANIVDGDMLVQKVTSKEYIEAINQILRDNPKLLNENADTLSKIIGRTVHKEGKYLPIKSHELKQMLKKTK